MLFICFFTQIRGTIRCLNWCVWFISLNILFSRYTHFPANVLNLFFTSFLSVCYTLCLNTSSGFLCYWKRHTLIAVSAFCLPAHLWMISPINLHSSCIKNLHLKLTSTSSSLTSHTSSYKLDHSDVGQTSTLFWPFPLTLINIWKLCFFLSWIHWDLALHHSTFQISP